MFPSLTVGSRLFPLAAPSLTSNPDKSSLLFPLVLSSSYLQTLQKGIGYGLIEGWGLFLLFSRSPFPLIPPALTEGCSLFPLVLFLPLIQKGAGCFLLFSPSPYLQASRREGCRLFPLILSLPLPPGLKKRRVLAVPSYSLPPLTSRPQEEKGAGCSLLFSPSPYLQASRREGCRLFTLIISLPLPPGVK